LAKTYRWDKKTSTHVELPWLVQPEGQGSGSIFSCAEDYAKWVHCMMKRSLPFSEDSHKELVKPRVIVEPDEDEERRRRFFSHQLYALGWEIETYRGQTMIGHSGSVPGFGSLVKYLPDLDWGIVVFGNSNGAGEFAETLFWSLVDDLLQVPAEERTDWVETVKEETRAYKEKSKDDIVFDETNFPFSKTLPLDQYVGRYSNAGYHNLSLQVKDGYLFVDCSDRSFPFRLTFLNDKGQRFVAELYDVLDGEVFREVKAFFEVEGGRVKSLGISIVEELPDDMVWFFRE